MESILKIIIIIFLTGCTAKSTEELEDIQNPNPVSLTDFGIKTNGLILFQLYQHYGFTDSEEQLILITQTNDKPKNLKSFPISNEDQTKLNRINTEKFNSTEFIAYKADMNANSDIRNNGYVYNRMKNIRITTNNSFYSISTNNQSETLTLYNTDSKLLFIESKRKAIE